MAQQTENQFYCWDNFKDYCTDNGISLVDNDDWSPWWETWKEAINSFVEYNKEERT